MSSVATRLEVSSASPDLLTRVRQAAAEAGAPEFALRLQALLHLPRVADAYGTVDLEIAERGLRDLGGLIRDRVAPFAELAKAPPVSVDSPRDLMLAEDEGLAREILTRFHYLGSFRPGSEHVIASTPEGRPVALATLSPFDLGAMADALPAGVAPDDVRVLARVFAFSWAPANMLTWLFGRVAHRAARDARLLLTYVNPNMGFTGASYRAGNWSLFGREHGTRYAYLDGRYVTDRELTRRYGTSSPPALAAQLGARVEHSCMRLQPLDIYALGLDTGLQADLATRPPRTFERPTP